MMEDELVIAHALKGPETDDAAELLRVLAARYPGRFAAEQDGGADSPSGDRGDAEVMAADLGSAEHVIARWPGRT
jgi:hypothetical protein